MLACWFGSNGSFDRKGNTLRCYLRVQCFGFSVLVACWHAGFARIDLSTKRVTFCVCTVLGFRDCMLACSHASFAQTDPSLENNGSLTKLQKWDLDNLSTASGHRACLRVLGKMPKKSVGSDLLLMTGCLLLRRTRSAPQGGKRVCIAKPILRDIGFA